MIDIYDREWLLSELETKNIEDLKEELDDDLLIKKIKNDEINVDFNIVPGTNDFYIFSGRKYIAINKDSFNDRVVHCTNADCTVDNSVNPTLLNIGGAYATNGVDSFSLGGVTLENDTLDGSNVFKYDNGMSTFTSLDAAQNIDVYKPELFYNGGKVFLVGGLNFTKNNSTINFDSSFNNNISIYNVSDTGAGLQVKTTELPDGLKNTIFSSIVEYSYDGKDGLLFVGGLQNDAGVFKVVDSVYFISFEELETGVSSNLTANFNLNIARFGHSVVVDDTNKVWVIGGLSENVTEDDTVKNDFVVESTIEMFIK